MTIQKIVITEDTPTSDYAPLLDLKVGDVFKIEGNYEELVNRIDRYVKNNNSDLEYFPINPGTSLYTMYGCNHFVITNEDNKLNVSDLEL